jgi:membrane-bound lytic murein transglycosylase A
MRSLVRVAGLALALVLSGPVMARQASVLEFAELEGWAGDNHAAALRVFRSTCGLMDGRDWQTLCALAARAKGREAARSFFEAFFRPVLVEDGSPGLFTGYYEPELDGSRHRGGRFRHPLYALPPEAPKGTPWLTRGEIEGGALAGRGLEIAWVDDPVEAFFLQIQGSGRVRLAEGGVLRLGYAGANGHPYRSVGQRLVARGALEPHELSMDRIKAWVAANPIDGAALLRTNPSFVFFREVSEVPAGRGPLGAMDRSVTALRSLAVDPRFVPLGAPVWIEKEGSEPMRRLMVAQDTGSAIKGAQRADIFFGTGARAGQRAGQVRDGGRMVVLLPIQRAYATLPETVAEGRLPGAPPADPS